jgi:hypothetical protein
VTTQFLPESPFVGLRPFRSEESLVFFGRRQQTVELLDRLHRTRFLSVVGSSGSGKSSLVRAGLIPKLEAGFLVADRDRWMSATMTPGDAPIKNLAAALLSANSVTPTLSNSVRLTDNIHNFGAHSIVDALKPVLDEDANCLLLVDQFEELFRFGLHTEHTQRRDEATDFVSILLALVEQRTVPVYVVMTMRSDFLGDCDAYFGLPEAMNRSQYLVPRLTRQQRREAVEGPIRLYGQTITPQLLDRVLNDAGEESDQLPVMQHALMRTWEKWSHCANGPLDLAHYEVVGGLKEALSLHAEEALRDMNETELRLAKQVFQALTDTDPNNRQIRRPARLSEIEAISGESKTKVLHTVEQFRGGGRSFLVISRSRMTDDSLVDISHESLIRQWPRLRAWVEQEAESRGTYRRVADAAGRYRAGKGGLWRDPDLQLALDWRKTERPNKAWAERYQGGFDDAMSFLEQCKEQREAEAREREIQLKKQRRRKLAVWAITFLGVALAIVTSSAMVAIWQYVRAREQTQEARLQMQEAERQKDMATHNAQEAAMQRRLAEQQTLLAARSAENAERERAKALAALKELTLATQAAVTTFSPQGKLLVTVSPDGTVGLWDSQSGRAIAQLKSRSAINLANFSPDGRVLVTASTDGSVQFWDPVTFHEMRRLVGGHTATVRKVVFSPDGQLLGTASDDKTARIWSILTGQELVVLVGHTGPVLDIQFSPDGKVATTSSTDGTTREWDVPTGRLIRVITRAGVAGVVG